MRKVYFLGIGGIGMSALARYFTHQGAMVAGYDKNCTALTQKLEEEGMQIHYQDSVAMIPEEFKDHSQVEVIYTPAVPENSLELNYFRQEGFQILKRSKALGYIAAEKQCLAVAGTHGKTTTSTLLAHLLQQCIGGCTAFLGGLSKNYQTNLLLSTNPYLVAEADEYDRSFLQLYPQAAVITSTDADHLDIYGDHKAVKESFADFASQVKSDGLLILKQGIDMDCTKLACTIARYSLDQPSDYFASQIQLASNGHYQFNIHTPKGIIANCTLGVRGLINVENAIAATALALYVGAKLEDIPDALASFTGVKRRFDVHIDTKEVTYIDDYAHHPAELKAAINSIKGMYPDRKLTAIFQPHLFSRTRDFATEFAQSLSLADQLVLLDIYPARELPISGVTADLIYDQVHGVSKRKSSKEQLIETLEQMDLDVVVSFGAGDIDTLIEPIKELLLIKK